MFDITTNDLIAVYEQLKNRYELTLTASLAADDGFEEDWPIIVGKSHGQIIWLYEYGAGEFVLDVMDEARTKGTHWYPRDVEDAVNDIVEFMKGKSDYELAPFKQM